MKTSAARQAILCFFLMWGTALWAQSSPFVFYSDLDSGPNSGGENNNGAWITLYGKGFGTSQGTVLIGSQPAVAYKQWNDGKISFQPGAGAPRGATTVSVKTANNVASNSVPFTVRPGNIFFVSGTGNDSNNGSFAAPWKTIVNAKNTIAPGDIAYVMNGVSQTGLDDYNASLAVFSAGTAGNPKALVAYPGATVTIGSATGQEFAIRTPAISGGPFSYWTLAGFVLRGNNEALDLVQMTNWRIVANDMSCPTGSGETACFTTENASNLTVLGNNVHDSGAIGSSKTYHSMYFSTDSNHIEVGWNVIANNHSCRGIQFHSTGSNNQFDLSVHDNLIHGQVCDGINFATIDPSKGPVLAYNNIVYSVGLGPDPPDGGSNYSCIYSPGITNAGPVGTGTAQIFNNTLYDCGPWGASAGSAAAGAISVQGGSPHVQFVNNIIVTLPGEINLGSSTDTTLISGSHNLFGNVVNGLPGAGAGIPQFTSNITADPKFADAAVANFHLLSGSPAIDGGVTPPVLITHDFDGNPRPSGAAFDVGAFEAVSASPAAPNPPTNLKAVAH